MRMLGPALKGLLESFCLLGTTFTTRSWDEITKPTISRSMKDGRRAGQTGTRMHLPVCSRVGSGRPTRLVMAPGQRERSPRDRSLREPSSEGWWRWLQACLLEPTFSGGRRAQRTQKKNEAHPRRSTREGLFEGRPEGLREDSSWWSSQLEGCTGCAAESTNDPSTRARECSGRFSYESQQNEGSWLRKSGESFLPGAGRSQTTENMLVTP